MFGLVSVALKDFSDLIHSGPWARRVLFFAGLMLISSGIFHLVVFVCERSSWEGPLSWRKPILFGISGGVTTLSVGWVVSLIAERNRCVGWVRLTEPWYCLSFAFSMVAEVALITARPGISFQRVAPVQHSHLLPHRISTMYGALAVVVLTVAAMGALPGPPDRNLAARSGLLLLVLACALGYWILQYGIQRVHQGLTPETYGEHGVMKFPHGLPLHSIQYLALQSWLMRYVGVSELWRVRLTASSATGLFLVTVFGLLQTLGAGPASTSPLSRPCCWSSVACSSHFRLSQAP